MENVPCLILFIFLFILLLYSIFLTISDLFHRKNINLFYIVLSSSCHKTDDLYQTGKLQLILYVH